MIRIAAALMISAFVTASAQHDSVAVRKAVQQVAQAFDTNDPALFDKLTTNDYTFVAPNGAIQTKAQRLTPMRSGVLHYTSSKYDEIAVHVYGSTAVATARVIVHATMGANDVSGTFRATQVLVRVKGHWLMVASQASALTT